MHFVTPKLSPLITPQFRGAFFEIWYDKKADYEILKTDRLQVGRPAW